LTAPAVRAGGLGLRENVIDLPEGPSVLIFTEEPLSGRFG
jgi:hypothetical protein